MMVDQAYVDANVRHEVEFLNLIDPFLLDVQYVLLQNNGLDPYEIDFKVVSRDPGLHDKFVAYMDLEKRGNDIENFPTIHVPKRDHESTTDRRKIETYRRHPWDSFHFSWTRGKGGFLILAHHIISSDVELITDTKTKRFLDVFDVRKDHCIKINHKDDLIPRIVKEVMRNV